MRCIFMNPNDKEIFNVNKTINRIKEDIVCVNRYISDYNKLYNYNEYLQFVNSTGKHLNKELVDHHVEISKILDNIQLEFIESKKTDNL